MVSRVLVFKTSDGRCFNCHTAASIHEKLLTCQEAYEGGGSLADIPWDTFLLWAKRNKATLRKLLLAVDAQAGYYADLAQTRSKG